VLHNGKQQRILNFAHCESFLKAYKMKGGGKLLALGGLVKD